MVLHSRGCGRVARRRFKRIGPPGRALGSREALFLCSLFGVPGGRRSGNPIFYIPRAFMPRIPSDRTFPKAFHLIEAAAYTDLLCITSYPSVVPSRIKSCITTRQRLNRPPTRVGANAVPNSGYIAAISAVPGISRIAIHNPATRTFLSISSLSRIPVRRATSPVEDK